MTIEPVDFLGWIAGASAVGLYSVGVSLAELVWYLPAALGGAILAKAPRSSDSSAQDYVGRGTRISVLFMLVISALGAALDPRIGVMWTGPTVCSPTILGTEALRWAAKARPCKWAAPWPISSRNCSSCHHMIVACS